MKREEIYLVYCIQSEIDSEKYYVGLTTNIAIRLEEHNAGESLSTKSFRPWKLIVCVMFYDICKAEKFEKYLKTGSGRIFCKKHF